MKKKGTLVYSLTTRGLFSELSNLVMAFYYANQKGLNFIINSRYWNGKIKKGWEDYFNNNIETTNSVFSAQTKVYSKEKPWVGNIYYNPKVFFNYYFQLLMNGLYCLFHIKCMLAKDAFEQMNSSDFRDSLPEDWVSSYASLYKQVVSYNEKTKSILAQYKEQLKLPDDYIGVHIRRGDKITTQEMDNISLDKYISEIIDHKDVSQNVFIATDDISILDSLRPKLAECGMKLYYNTFCSSSGFEESAFNDMDERRRYDNIMLTLLDMDILIHSCFFIGTYTSNLSRIVPLFLSFSRCKSLDIDWDFFYCPNY